MTLPPSNPHEPAAPDPSFRVIPSGELLSGDRAVLIEHGGEFYRLIVTKNDKLMLQK